MKKIIIILITILLTKISYSQNNLTVQNNTSDDFELIVVDYSDGFNPCFTDYPNIYVPANSSISYNLSTKFTITTAQIRHIASMAPIGLTASGGCGGTPSPTPTIWNIPPYSFIISWTNSGTTFTFTIN